MLPPAQRAQWLGLDQRKAKNQSALQRSYRPAAKALGLAVRCIRR
jgi:hypothetical protein